MFKEVVYVRCKVTVKAKDDNVCMCGFVLTSYCGWFLPLDRPKLVVIACFHP